MYTTIKPACLPPASPSPKDLTYQPPTLCPSVDTGQSSDRFILSNQSIFVVILSCSLPPPLPPSPRLAPATQAGQQQWGEEAGGWVHENQH